MADFMLQKYVLEKRKSYFIGEEFPKTMSSSGSGKDDETRLKE